MLAGALVCAGTFMCTHPAPAHIAALHVSGLILSGVTLSVPALTKGMTDVKVLHFSTERKVWEVITPSNVDLDNKEITFELQDLSPIAIIAKVDASQAVTNTTGTSPKTGVDSTNTVPFAGAAVVLLGAAAVVAFRKKNA